MTPISRWYAERRAELALWEFQAVLWLLVLTIGSVAAGHTGVDPLVRGALSIWLMQHGRNRLRPRPPEPEAGG